MAGPRGEVLRAFMAQIWTWTLQPATTGLTDEEFWWEPLPGCWTLRPVSEQPSAGGWVRGGWSQDVDERVVEPPGGAHPWVTIAWLAAHSWDSSRLTQFRFLGGDREPGDYSPADDDPGFALTADAAVARLKASWDRLADAIDASTDERLEEPWEWEFGPTNGWHHLVLMLNEVSHHGSQICQIRDLYRHTFGPDGAGGSLQPPRR